MNLNLNIKVDDDCFIPRQGTKEAAGYDLIANLNEELITLYPLTTTKIDAGFRCNYQRISCKDRFKKRSCK